MNRNETRLLVENWRNLISDRHHLSFDGEIILNEGIMEKIKKLSPKAAALAFAMTLFSAVGSDAHASNNNTIPESEVKTVFANYLKKMGIKKFDIKTEDGKLLVRFNNDVQSHVQKVFQQNDVKADKEGNYYVMTDSIESLTAPQIKRLAATASSGIDRFVDADSSDDGFDTKTLFSADQDIIDSIKKLGSNEIDSRLDKHFKEDKKKFSGHKERQYNNGFDQAQDYFEKLDKQEKEDLILSYGSENNFYIYGGLQNANCFQILDF